MLNLDVLKDALELKGISHEAGAAIMGRSKKTFLKTLRGERDIQVIEVLRLQAALHEKGCWLTLDDLAGYTSTTESAPTS